MLTFAYMTSLQHDVINNLLSIRYNLPTNSLFLLSLKYSGNVFPIIFFYVELSTYLLMTLLTFFIFSICVYSYTVIALLNNCPMHGDLASSAWLKINGRKNENTSRNFSRYILTEIKIFLECLI